jgi:hypothetical protein
MRECLWWIKRVWLRSSVADILMDLPQCFVSKERNLQKTFINRSESQPPRRLVQPLISDCAAVFGSSSFPRFLLWHRFAQTPIDSLHQLQLCFCILVFAVLDDILQLVPQELDLRRTKLCQVILLGARNREKRSNLYARSDSQGISSTLRQPQVRKLLIVFTVN